ncbi:MAG: DNA repair protein RecO [Acidobacteria bacterium]|nr:DNA repair protein RecO [Acidobacteriota bacterium]
MPVYKSDALILRTYKLAESDRIVVFLTKDRGKKRGVARGARRLRSRFVGSLEPMTLGSVAYFEKETRELVSINYVETTRSPFAVSSPEALGYVEYFAELLDEWSPDSDPNERLYRLGAALVEALAAGVPIDPLARYFEYWLLRLQGVYPSALTCHRCGAPLQEAWLRPDDRVFSCGDCAGAAGAASGTRGAMLSASAMGFLRLAASLAPDRLGEMTLAPGAGRELEAVHRALITTHLEKELRSSRVLRQMA